MVPNLSLAWSTTNAKVATVTSGGTASGTGTGTDTVLATAGSTTGRGVVQVSSVPIANVTITPNSATITYPSTVQLTATVTDSAGHAVRNPTIGWSSTPTGRVSSSGLVTPQLADTATGVKVMATDNGIVGTSQIAVKPALPNHAPTGETFVFDKDTLVPFGVPFDISQHVRWIVTDGAGDSVGSTTLASVSTITYYPTEGNANPGNCIVLAETFVAYCPDGGSTQGGAASSTNGYWSVAVHAQSVNGVPNQQNAIRWYVNSNFPGSRVMSFAASSPTVYAVAIHTPVTLSNSLPFYVQTTGGLTVATVPIASLGANTVYGQGTTNGWCDTGTISGATICPGSLTECTVSSFAVTCPPEIVNTANGLMDVPYDVIVHTIPGPFNGVSNPSFSSADTVNVIVPPNVELTAASDTLPVGGSETLTADTLSPVDGHTWYPVPPGPGVQWTTVSGLPSDSISAGGMFYAFAPATVRVCVSVQAGMTTTGPVGGGACAYFTIIAGGSDPISADRAKHAISK